MKTIVGLIVIVALVLGTMVGCQTTPSEQVYRDLSVGPMTVSIPDDWQRPEDYEEGVEEIYTGLTEEERQAIQVDAYADESEDAVIMLVTIDMVASFESMGLPWRGWDIELQEMGMTVEEFSEMAQYSMTSEFTELSRETHQQLTIGGHEAWETTYSAKSGGEPAKICVLIIFAPDDLGMLALMVKQAKWSKFEGTWDTIRDSVRI